MNGIIFVHCSQFAWFRATNQGMTHRASRCLRIFAGATQAWRHVIAALKAIIHAGVPGL